MADDVWGRPRIPTGDSVAAALRLAKELKPDESLLCDRDDGATELLVRQDGDFLRYVAYESGAREQVEARGPLDRLRIVRRVIHGALLCIPLILAAGFFFKPDDSNLWIGGPFALVFGLVFVAALLQKHHDLEALAPTGAPSARIPYKLGGWRPRTVAQLAAVEDLCKAAGENARVRNIADGAVEVLTYRRRQRRRHVLDAFGSIVEHDVSAVSGGVYWTVKLAALSFVIPFAALLVFDGPRSFFIGLAFYMLLLVIASRVDARKHLARPGEEWFEIQLEAPSD
jgi:hypothetical protein